MYDWRGSTTNRRVFLASVPLVPLALALGGCGSTEKFRYKMTVEVETPHGIRRGYAVREILLRRPPNIPMLGEDRGSASVRGEAVAVEIAPGKTLFALMRGQHGDADYAGTGVMTIFRVMDRSSGRKGGPHELWPNIPTIREPITDPLPTLVTFRDQSDPATVEAVDPHTIGVKRILIETTSEPITTGIEKRLPWWNAYLDRHFDGTTTIVEDMTDPSIAAHLSARSFSTEIGK